MKSPSGEGHRGLRLRLPATSANLGPGFDAVAVALDFYLEIEAKPASEFSIDATGRDAARCSQLQDNLILGVYQQILSQNNQPIPPLAIRMANGIPLGMGCGSSAAGILAGIALAIHFGDLGWGPERILETATTLEGHPDNVAACWLGGFVACGTVDKTLQLARVEPPPHWHAIVVLPRTPLATSKARAILPDKYSRTDVVTNIQSASILGLAFAQARGDLLRSAMQDRVHQPYRAAICPLLRPLLPLAGQHHILGVALSGAGPAVLVVVESEAGLSIASQAICSAVRGLEDPEMLISRFALNPAESLELPT
ncbi:MAG TPA: homoserine kinase [Terracidiphilus sp.]|jgi:homoserine kinase|nr:homoserine kinase [Terracidiphilus sp.]